MEAAPARRISRRKLTKLHHDPSKSAEIVNLKYVTDQQEGILRIKKGKGFSYQLKGKVVKDPDILQRIRSLVIPPAWQKVWICPDADGHLQVTGYDAKGRKQYRYHPRWNVIRSHTKFFHLLEFGNALPTIRQQLDKDLSLRGLPQRKVLAAVVAVMQDTSIRIGNELYEKLNGSYGLTTLKDKHVQFTGRKVLFSFVGKKGVKHQLNLQSRKLAKIVRQCRDIPGKELFQYYDEDGKHYGIDSGMVNEYIKEVSGGEFSAKDFRTWAGTLHALSAFKGIEKCTTQQEAKKRIVEVLDTVAYKLGNTRSVCKKYYVHPALIDMFTNGRLERHIKGFVCSNVPSVLKDEEQLLLKILEAQKVELE